MLLASLFLVAFARSVASPVPATIPGAPIPSPVCVVAAAITASQCDPTRTRTIFDILYSCIGVILLCTYISMHHNIPDQDDSPMKVAWLKIRTTLYALVAPEMVIMWAIRQRIMAGRIAEQNKHRGWTRTHGFFVQMGGLMQRVDDGGEVTYRVAGVTTPGSPSVNWTAVKIPRIPEKEIKDHGKGDLLAKVIVVLQTTWFVAQCIARHVQGLVLTEIELVTLAFATLNVVTYGVWWDKPLSIEYPIYFDENGVRADGPEEKKSNDPWYRWFWTRKKEYGYDVLEGGDEAQPHRQGVMKTIWIKGITTPFVAIFRPLADMIEEVGDGNRETSVHPFHASNMSGDDQSLAVIYGSTIGVVFGGIHLIGWNFQFPTLPELWLWRASSLVLTVVPFNLIIGYAFNIAFLKTSNSSLERLYEGIVHVFLYPIGFVGAPLYFVARIVILSLAFFTLRDLSESAYENSAFKHITTTHAPDFVVYISTYRQLKLKSACSSTTRIGSTSIP